MCPPTNTPTDESLKKRGKEEEDDDDLPLSSSSSGGKHNMNNSSRRCGSYYILGGCCCLVIVLVIVVVAVFVLLPNDDDSNRSPSLVNCNDLEYEKYPKDMAKDFSPFDEMELPSLEDGNDDLTNCQSLLPPTTTTGTATTTTNIPGLSNPLVLPSMEIHFDANVQVCSTGGDDGTSKRNVNGDFQLFLNNNNGVDDDDDTAYMSLWEAQLCIEVDENNVYQGVCETTEIIDGISYSTLINSTSITASNAPGLEDILGGNFSMQLVTLEQEIRRRLGGGGGGGYDFVDVDDSGRSLRRGRRLGKFLLGLLNIDTALGRQIPGLLGQMFAPTTMADEPLFYFHLARVQKFLKTFQRLAPGQIQGSQAIELLANRPNQTETLDGVFAFSARQKTFFVGARNFFRIPPRDIDLPLGITKKVGGRLKEAVFGLAADSLSVPRQITMGPELDSFNIMEPNLEGNCFVEGTVDLALFPDSAVGCTGRPFASSRLPSIVATLSAKVLLDIDFVALGTDFAENSGFKTDDILQMVKQHLVAEGTLTLNWDARSFFPGGEDSGVTETMLTPGEVTKQGLSKNLRRLFVNPTCELGQAGIQMMDYGDSSLGMTVAVVAELRTGLVSCLLQGVTEIFGLDDSSTSLMIYFHMIENGSPNNSDADEPDTEILLFLTGTTNILGFEIAQLSIQARLSGLNVTSTSVSNVTSTSVSGDLSDETELFFGVQGRMDLYFFEVEFDRSLLISDGEVVITGPLNKFDDLFYIQDASFEVKFHNNTFEATMDGALCFNSGFFGSDYQDLLQSLGVSNPCLDFPQATLQVTAASKQIELCVDNTWKLGDKRIGPSQFCWGNTPDLRPVLAGDNGDYCALNRQCKSNWCSETAGFVCQQRLPNGEFCLTNDNCESNWCSETAGFVCQQRLTNGEFCFTNDNCISNWCSQTAGSVCRQRLAPGQACATDDQCASGECSWLFVCN